MRSPLSRRRTGSAAPGSADPRAMGLQTESGSLSLREAGAATPVVVPGAKARAVVARGAAALCADGLQGRASIALVRDATPKRCCRWRGSMPHAGGLHPSPIDRHKDGLLGCRDALKGGRGEQESSPGKVSAVVPRTPCTSLYPGLALSLPWYQAEKTEGNNDIAHNDNIAGVYMTGKGRKGVLRTHAD